MPWSRMVVADFLYPLKRLGDLGYSAEPSDYASDTTFAGDDEQPLLQVRDLKVHFPIKKGFFGKTVDHVKAVDGVSFDVYRGQTLGFVGESGCGKTDGSSRNATHRPDRRQSFSMVLTLPRCLNLSFGHSGNAFRSSSKTLRITQSSQNHRDHDHGTDGGARDWLQL